MNRLLALSVHLTQWRSVRHLVRRHHRRDPNGAWALPFQILDRHLSADRYDPPDLEPLAALLPGGQGRLFSAILQAMAARDTSPLDAIVRDRQAHIETRFEAMGWALFLARRATCGRGNPPAAVMQFWDRNPPREIDAARRAWRDRYRDAYAFCDADAAGAFVEQHHGPAMRRRFDAAWHPALKADIFRLAWLSVAGGLYVDADMMPGTAILARSRTAAVSATNVPRCCVTTGILFGTGADRIWTGFLEAIMRDLDPAKPAPINGLSGPAALTRFLYLNPDLAAGIDLFPYRQARQRIARQFDAGYKYTPQNWRVFEHGQGLDDAGFYTRLAAEL